MAADAAAAEQLQLNTFPETPLRVALFTDVTNGGELLGLLTSGTMEPEVAFINAALVASPFALQLAAHKALAASKRTTRTLHSDLVFHLSPTNHITESLRRFGVGATTRALVVARLGGGEAEFAAACARVAGARAPFCELGRHADGAALAACVKAAPEEAACSSLQDSLLTRVACKEVS